MTSRPAALVALVLVLGVPPGAPLGALAAPAPAPPQERPAPTQQLGGGRIAVAGGYWAVTQPESGSLLLYDASTDPPHLLDVVGAEGTGGGQLRGPAGVGFDLSRQRLYVVDAGNHRVQAFVLVPGPDGRAGRLRFAKAVGQRGSAPGELDDPAGLATTPDGRVLVCDRANGRVQVFDPMLHPVASWGNGVLAGPLEVAVDPSERDGVVAWVVDAPARRVHGLDATGRSVRAWGLALDDAAAPPERPGFAGPFGLAVAPDGSVFVGDVSRHLVQHFDRDGHRLGWFGGYGKTAGRLLAPTGLAMDGGRLLVVDRRSAIVQAAGTDGEPHPVLTLDAMAPLAPAPR